MTEIQPTCMRTIVNIDIQQSTPDNLPLPSSYVSVSVIPNKELVSVSARGPFLITLTWTFGGCFFVSGHI